MVRPKIKISVVIIASILKTWQLWTNPEDIIHWNYATPEWYTPKASLELMVGGKFNFRMEAKDDNIGFDFSGTFTEVIPTKRLSYIMTDGRNVTVTFDEKSGATTVTEEFEAESENSLELQKTGWQSILETFKSYAESYKTIDLHPCIWFEKDGHQAAKFYNNVFKPSGIFSVDSFTTMFELKGYKFMALNGGPKFGLNTSISFMVSFNEESELESSWNLLIKGGEVLFPLDAYPWSPKYGYCQDQYGVCWQVIKAGFANTGESTAISLMFTNERAGKAEEAMHFYTGIFPHSYIHSINRFQSGEDDSAGRVKHGLFILADKFFTATDNSSSLAPDFTEGISIVIPCDTQDQIDYYWTRLTDGGEESMCGWLKDKYGVSWQVVPSILEHLMSDPDKRSRVIQAFLKMKKFDIETLLKA